MAFNLLKRFEEYRSETIAEFYLHINDLLEHELVQDLDQYIQHYCFSRLKHSLDVAYYSFFLARFFHWDARSTARGALLHDLFHYDCQSETLDRKGHARNHPRIAVENAKKICDLNQVEENIIRRHMWLITLIPPRYKEGMLVTFIDKYCAVREFFIGVRATGKTMAPALPSAKID